MAVMKARVSHKGENITFMNINLYARKKIRSGKKFKYQMCTYINRISNYLIKPILRLYLYCDERRDI